MSKLPPRGKLQSNFPKFFTLLGIVRTLDQVARETRSIHEAERNRQEFDNAKPSEKLGKGRLGNEDDFENMKGVFLTSQDHGPGVFLGLTGGKAMIYHGDGHLNTYGRTRSGKGTTVIFNTLAYSNDRSFFVCDVKEGENAYGTAKHRAEVLGHKVLFLSTSTLHGFPVTKLNPLRGLIEAVQKRGKLQGEAVEMAVTLVPPRDAEKSQWVINGARRLLAARMEYLAHCEPENCHLVSLWRFINCSDNMFRRMLGEMSICGIESVEGKANQIASLAIDAPEQFSAIRDEAGTAIQSFEPGKDLATAVVEDEGEGFDFASLKTSPTTVYLMAKSAELNAIAKWATLVTSYLIEVTAAAKGPIPVTFLMDEFPQFPQSPVIPKAIRLYAGKNINFWTFSQGRHSMRERWSEPFVREVEEQAAVNQFWGITDTGLISDIKVWSGETSVILQGDSYNGGSIQNSGSSISEQRRSVLQSEDILNYGDNRQLLRFAGFPHLVEADRVPWYELSPYRDQLQDTRLLFSGEAPENNAKPESEEDVNGTPAETSADYQ